MSIYDYTFTKNNGETVSLSEFKGKPILIVNTASKCGFTYQYEGLEKLYNEYKTKGLVVIGFPCNQFLGQEPEEDSKVEEFCKANYGVSFILSKKVEVNGDNETDLFKFLKKEAPFKGFANEKEESILKPILEENYPTFLENDNIKWNFTKFLVSPTGDVKRFEPSNEPSEIASELNKYL